MKLFILVFIIFLSTAVGFGQKAKDGPPPKNVTADDVPRITLSDAKKAFDESSAVFVDARAFETYKGGHVKGAVNIPFGSTENFDSIPKGKKIILYCS